MNCPSCHKPMILRRRKTDRHQFYGCSTYPKCKRTAPVYLDEESPVSLWAEFCYEEYAYDMGDR